MTHDEVIKALEEHNKWRRNEPPYNEGISAAMMPVKPKELGEVIEYAIEFMKRYQWQPIETLNKKIRFDYVYETEKGNRYIVYGAYWHKKAGRIQGTRLGQPPYNGCKILFWRPEDKPPQEEANDQTND